tara:strand:+ start:36004 stop:37323 length:1320 start_codon:yes stop_codon:yes gene_type:complete
MLYRLLKFVIGIGIRLYYKEIRINNKKYLKSGGKPMIIVANHPNTLMDAWVIGMVCNQPIYYMAKATLFDSSFKLKLLRSLNMIPINRKGEGTIKGVDNQDSLSECYKILSEGKTLVIFPEGTSYKERVLRKLKTGTARIALETEHLNDWKLDVQIVAVGLNYSQQERFQSDILIDIDKPRNVQQYKEEYETDKRAAAQRLTSSIRKRLEDVLVTVESQDEELLVDQIYRVLNTKYSNSEKGVNKEVKEMKEITKRLDEIKILQPWLLEEIKIKIKSINWKLEKMHIRTDFLDRKFRSIAFFRQIMISILFVLIALPIALFGVIHNIFQYLFADWLVPKISTDIEYYAPLAILVGIVLYPLIYTGAAIGAYHLFDLNWYSLLIYIVLMPLTGLFAYWFAKYLRNISYQWQYMLLLVDRKQTLKELQQEKGRLKTLVFDT